MLLEAPPDELHLEGPRRTIKLSLQLRSGEGYWAVYGVPAAGADTEAAQLLDEGAFRLTLGAQFEWSGARGKMEMDALAEALVTLVLEQENSR